MDAASAHTAGTASRSRCRSAETGTSAALTSGPSSKSHGRGVSLCPGSGVSHSGSRSSRTTCSGVRMPGRRWNVVRRISWRATTRRSASRNRSGSSGPSSRTVARFEPGGPSASVDQRSSCWGESRKLIVASSCIAVAFRSLTDGYRTLREMRPAVCRRPSERPCPRARARIGVSGASAIRWRSASRSEASVSMVAGSKRSSSYSK